MAFANNYQLWSFIAVCVFTVTAITLSYTTNILKDVSLVKNKPYSYSRVQMMFWLVIIVDAYMLAYGWHEDIVALNSSCLVLLGISAGTAAAGRVIDNSRSDDDNAVMQNQPSEGFLKDILSDQSGISIHRFQSVVFNIIFGVIFIVKFLASLKASPAYPLFNDTDLALMGISSATYIGMKIGENGSLATTTPAPAQVQQTTAPAPAPAPAQVQQSTPPDPIPAPAAPQSSGTETQTVATA